MSVYDFLFGIHKPPISVMQRAVVPKQAFRLNNTAWRDRLRRRKMDEYYKFDRETLEAFWKHMYYVYQDPVKTEEWQRQWRRINRTNFKRFKWFI